VQASINRQVGLKILDATSTARSCDKSTVYCRCPCQSACAASLDRFRLRSGRSGWAHLYAHEYIEGANLAELEASGERIDEPTVLKVLRTVGEGLAYLHAQSTPHTPLDPSKIYLGTDGHPRLANLATQYPEQQLTPEREIQLLGKIILSVAVPVQQLSSRLADIAQSDDAARGRTPSTRGLRCCRLSKPLEPKVVPMRGGKNQRSGTARRLRRSKPLVVSGKDRSL
jgi:serine/threonine protein kinase